MSGRWMRALAGTGATVLATATVLAAPAAAAPQDDARGAIAAAMADSQAGWNAGDAARFMAIYAADAVYMSGTTLVRGRAAIATRYAAAFAGGVNNTRGRLGLVPLEWRAAGPRHMLLVGRWTLTPASGAAERGLTTLLFEKRAEGWRVVADHSS